MRTSKVIKRLLPHKQTAMSECEIKQRKASPMGGRLCLKSITQEKNEKSAIKFTKKTAFANPWEISVIFQRITRLL